MARESEVHCVSEKTTEEKPLMDDGQKNRITQKRAVSVRKKYIAIVLGIILVLLYIVVSTFVLVYRPTPKKNLPGTNCSEAVYEILTESFQDSSEFHNGFPVEGDGVGDIKGKYR